MNGVYKVIRWFSPTLCIWLNVRRINRELQRRRLKPWTTSRSDEERDKISNLVEDRREFEEWRLGIDDKALIKKAAKIGVDLDDIIYLPTEDDSAFNTNFGRYHCVGTFGDEHLRDDFRKLLVKAVREREPSFTKERRERLDFYASLLVKIITALSGLLGLVLGIIAVSKH